MFQPNPLPIVALQCAGSNYGVSTQGHDFLYFTNPSLRASQLLALADGRTNRIMWHMPCGWTQGNTFAAPMSRVQPAPLKAFHAALSPTWRALGIQTITYGGSRLPRANNGTGAAVLDSTSQAAGASETFAPLLPEHATWYVDECAETFGEWAHELWFDAMNTAADMLAVQAVEQRGRARGWFEAPIGGEALPLNFGPSNTAADNTIDRTRSTQRPFMFLERNYSRTFDPNGLWTFDTNHEEAHCFVDGDYAYWTRAANDPAGGGGLSQAQALGRLDNMRARGIIVSLFLGAPQYVVDWHADVYAPVFASTKRRAWMV